MLAAGSAFAQTNAEVNAGIQFNFSTPGARSLGLGGAFIGLADDATAAFTNPAGLIILSQPEVSLEGRSWSYTHEASYRGRDFGLLSGEGVDDTPEIVLRDFENDVSTLSFASFVYPRGRWAFAVYRHVLADFEADIESQGPFLDALFPGFENFGELSTRFFPFRSSLDLEIVNYGVSGAFRITEGLSIGLGAGYYDYELESLTQRFALSATPDTAPGGAFGPADFSPGNEVNFQTLQGDDEDVAAIVGILWETAAQWSLGAVYREGPTFDFQTLNAAGRFTNNPQTVFAEKSGEFKVPDVYGIGLAYRPNDKVTIMLDYDRVEYSDLTANVVEIFLPAGDPNGPPLQAAADRLEIDDADEIHLGFEHVFPGLPVPLALRLGTFYDPDHKVAFEGTPGRDPDQRAAATIFREGEDELHFSVGLGVFFKDFQVDAAADFSDLIETFSLSGAYRF